MTLKSAWWVCGLCKQKVVKVGAKRGLERVLKHRNDVHKGLGGFLIKAPKK